MAGAPPASRVMATFIVVEERGRDTSAAETTWVVGSATTAAQFLVAFDTTTARKVELHALQSQPAVTVFSPSVLLSLQDCLPSVFLSLLLITAQSY